MGDLGLIPGLGRSPGEGKGYPLLYSGLETSMDCTVRAMAKSLTRPSGLHLHRLSPVVLSGAACLVVPGLLTAVAFPVVMTGGRRAGFSGCCEWALVSSCVVRAVATGLSYTEAHRVFLDQGSNPCPLNWQANCYPSLSYPPSYPLSYHSVLPTTEPSVKASNRHNLEEEQSWRATAPGQRTYSVHGN